MAQNELYHHGILGMKWGIRNGPPYPLDPEDHSAREKRLSRFGRSSNKDTTKKKKKKSSSTTDTTKKSTTSKSAPSKEEQKTKRAKTERRYVDPITRSVKDFKLYSLERSRSVNKAYKDKALEFSGGKKNLASLAAKWYGMQESYYANRVESYLDKLKKQGYDVRTSKFGSTDNQRLTRFALQQALFAVGGIRLNALIEAPLDSDDRRKFKVYRWKTTKKK